MKIISLMAVLAIFISSCSYIKISPEYQGVDPKIQYLVDEYMELSRLNHLTFSRPVTIGFKKINIGLAVGLCTYGIGWREIDVDIDFWNKADGTQRLTLIFHELTHCYCARGHDYGPGIKYLASEQERITEAMKWQKKGGPKPGRLEDGCPSSLMFPIVASNECVISHYSEYTNEMFNRCDPY